MASWLQNRLKAAEELLESVDRQAKSAAVPRSEPLQQGREREKSSAPSATFKASDQIGTASTKQARVGHKAPPPPGVPVSETAHQQHGASSSSADAHPRSTTDSEGSYSVSTGAIPFSIQPVQPQQSSIESSNSAAMLQRPPAPRQPLFRESKPAPQQAESLAEPSRASAEKPSDSMHATEGKPGPSTDADSAAEHEHDDGPMEEILLHTDTESVSNELQEKEAQPPWFPEPAAQPTSTAIESQETADSNGPSSIQQSSRDASAAVAEAIAAANRAAQSSSTNAEARAEAAAAVERETRLARMVDQLRRRLEQQQAENLQLEDLLRQADASLSERTTEVQDMMEELNQARQAHSTLEGDLAGALALQQQEAQSIAKERDAAMARALAAEKQASDLKVANDKLFQQQQESQDDMVNALRGEVANAERHLEEERSSHADARRRFVAREAELEASMGESAAALAAMQRSLEDRTRRATAAEELLSALEAEKAALSVSLSALQEQAAGRAVGEDQAAVQSHTIEELHTLRAAYQEQQSTLAAVQQHERTLQQQAQSLQQEVEQLRAESRKSAQYADLQRQFQEVTELLYQKHTQLERMAAEKAAQQLTMEREIATAREHADRNHRRVARANSLSGSDGDVLVPMEAMGEAYNRLANHGRLGSAVKAGSALLDATASTTVRMLKQHPLGRLGAFAYIIFIHLFLWVVIQRLQHKALSSDPMLGANITHMHRD